MNSMDFLKGKVTVYKFNTHLDSSNGCWTVSMRGCLNFVNCCGPFFILSMISSLSRRPYLSICDFSNMKTETSYKKKKIDKKDCFDVTKTVILFHT